MLYSIVLPTLIAPALLAVIALVDATKPHLTKRARADRS